MQFEPRLDHQQLKQHLTHIRGPRNQAPDATIVIPVNAQGDLDNVLTVVSDLARYGGRRRFEVALVVNNYAPDHPPTEIEQYRDLGMIVVSVPNVRKPGGEAVCLSARVPGIRAAGSDVCVLFDADVRIPYATEIVDWYVNQLSAGVGCAYTFVGYYDLPKGVSLKFRFAIHHGTRWLKRVVLRIPPTRGSSYGVNRAAMLAEYEKGTLADDLNIGPAIKAAGHKIAYGRSKKLRVYTSGRMFHAGWLRMLPYFWYRLKYNLRTLPVRPDAASRTGRDNDPADRYVYTNKQAGA